MNGRHAIIVGINGYTEESGLNQLKYAESDAEQFSNVLEEKYGYDVSLLSGVSASRENIMQEFVRIGKIDHGQKFVFFFAGHGQTLGEEYYLHPSNAQIDSDIFSVRMNRLLDYFERGLSHKEVICIVDACHKEMNTNERGDIQLDPIATRDVSKRIQQNQNTESKMIKVLYGCGINQSSYEDDHLKHGVLTYHLLDHIRDNGGNKSFDTIARELGEEIPGYVKRRFGSMQSPMLFTPLTIRESFLGDIKDKRAQHSTKEKINKLERTNIKIDIDDLIESGMLEEFVDLYGGKIRGRAWFKFYEDIKRTFTTITQPKLRELVEPIIAKRKREEEKILAKMPDNSSAEIIEKNISPDKILNNEEKEQFLSELQIEMVAVKKGSFEMGSNIKIRGEYPTHAVELNEYYIGKYPVTFDQYDKYCEEVGNKKPNDKGWGRGNKPVINVSWEDAAAFCIWLSEKTGDNYRLPTEAEWEFAAKGGAGGNGYNFSGSNNLDDVGWYLGNSGRNSSPVGTKLPNELGIYDMSGNVCEWCSDWFNENYYEESPVKNPEGPAEGYEKVIRGGASNFNVHVCRVTHRASYYPSISTYNCGFRIVKAN